MLSKMRHVELRKCNWKWAIALKATTITFTAICRIRYVCCARQLCKNDSVEMRMNGRKNACKFFTRCSSHFRFDSATARNETVSFILKRITESIRNEYVSEAVINGTLASQFGTFRDLLCMWSLCVGALCRIVS